MMISLYIDHMDGNGPIKNPAIPADEWDALYAEWQREQAKSTRQSAVDAIKVTVATGKVFDGDETSQTRMSRAIVAMQAAGVSEINWTLADNTNVPVTLAELTEALVLAGSEQARLWVL